jgi:hypothetical protein
MQRYDTAHGPAQVAAGPFFEVNEAGIIEASSLRLAGSRWVKGLFSFRVLYFARFESCR